jgi:predicted  nucleic acid-binding Zn-ribbon protein
MKMTSAEAAKLLRKLNEEYGALKTRESMSCTFVAAIQEDLESARPVYDYAATQAQMEAVEAKVRRVKHAINAFNQATVIPGFGMTIDEMLVYLPMLTNRKARLSNMAAVLPKQRERSYGQSSIIEYRYANYDLTKVQEDLAAVTDELSRAQIALDKVNSTETREIEL